MIMKRRVNGLVRYYRIDLFQNLFGEWIIVRVFGSMKRSKPTGEIVNVYQKQIEAQQAYGSLIERKMKKGYQKAIHTKE